jgi:outer membrane protein assembly factor BamB
MNDIAGSPVIDRGQVYAVSHSGRMVAIDLRSGQRIWSQEIASIETPWVAGNFIYMVTTDGELVCLYRRDGSVKWLTQLKAYKDPKTRKRPIVWSGPIMVDNELFIVSSNKQALVVNAVDGKIIRGVKLPDKVYTAPIIANNIVYVYTNDAELIAFGDPALAGPAHPSSPRVHHEAKPEPGEIKKDHRSIFSPRIPDWFPVF